MAVEIVIVGGGLAGTTLAWEFWWRGRDFVLVDAAEKITCSKVAAGLITPITGKRLAVSWQVQRMWTAALAFHARIEPALGRSFLHRQPVARLLKDDVERRRLEDRLADPEFRALVAAEPFRPPAAVRTPSAGGFDMALGGWLNVAEFLTASHDFFARVGRFEVGRPDPREAAERDARHAIFCEGWLARNNPFFPWLKWKSAKGEILTLRVPTWPAADLRPVSAGTWFVPLGRGDGLVRSGSTYEWDRLDCVPTEEKRELLLASIREKLTVDFETVGHAAAVRPIIRESRALIGLHPSRPKLGFFNGLGSKGSLHAPYFARQLAAHLCEGSPLEPECDLQRND